MQSQIWQKGTWQQEQTECGPDYENLDQKPAGQALFSAEGTKQSGHFP